MPYEIVVDLVGDDWDIVPGGHFEDVLQVLPAED